MRLQSSQANCGSTSVYNAAQALGRTNITLEECERECKVSATDGTPTKRLLAGIRALGLKVAGEIKEARDDVALLKLDAELREGRAAILAVDADSHWVAAIGKCGSRYLVADSADNEVVLSMSPGELAQRWQNPGARRGFYAAVMGTTQ